MIKVFHVVFVACFILFAAAGSVAMSGAKAPAGTGVKNKISETLKPSGIHEDCMELFPGQTLEYSFESSKPLNFNVHYHDDSKIVFSVKKDASSADKGSVAVKLKQHYCLMWTNEQSETVDLGYFFTVKGEGK